MNVVAGPAGGCLGVRILHAHVVESEPLQQRPVLGWQRQCECVLNKLLSLLLAQVLLEGRLDDKVRSDYVSGQLLWSFGTLTIVEILLVV